MKNILIVDENKDILDALSESLCSSLKDCSILIASNSAKGGSIMKTTPIDLVLTELLTPAMNGYGFIEQVKKSHPSVPVCVMTGNCSPDVVERFKSMGVVSWIEKPFQFDRLAQMIAEELRKEKNIPQ
jgi:DNA-binding NtrC family response regulator